MLIEGRQDEQSKYQARDIESKDNPAVMNKVPVQQLPRNNTIPAYCLRLTFKGF